MITITEDHKVLPYRKPLSVTTEDTETNCRLPRQNSGSCPFLVLSCVLLPW